MIKNYNPRSFEQLNSLPPYMVITEQYELLAKTKTGYIITLAKLTVGQSKSAGNPLNHVLFESFSDHGERMAVARTRIIGHGHVFSAVMNAMMEIGVEFESVALCHSETMLTAIEAWIQVKNPDIEQYKIMSLNCH